MAAFLTSDHTTFEVVYLLGIDGAHILAITKATIRAIALPRKTAIQSFAAC